MKLQNFVLLDNAFSSCGTYKGISGTDDHGNYVIFPPEAYGIIKAADFAKTETGKIVQFFEQDSVIINEVRHLKLYYK